MNKEIYNLVNEWDTIPILYLIEQTKVSVDIDKVIIKKIKKKQYIIPPMLFYTKYMKDLLNELILKYSIQEIDDVIRWYVESRYENAKLPPDRDYYNLYQKKYTISVKSFNCFIL